jgi:hypothetical protein
LRLSKKWPHNFVPRGMRDRIRMNIGAQADFEFTEFSLLSDSRRNLSGSVARPARRSGHFRIAAAQDSFGIEFANGWRRIHAV